MNGYLKSFIIGSSWPVIILFLIVVARLKNKNYRYDTYSMIAPVYLGLMNMLSLYLARRYNLSLRMRYVVIGLISPLIVIAIGMSLGSYNFTCREWQLYSMRLIVKHFLIFNVIVYLLELGTQEKEHFISKTEEDEVNKMVSLIIKRGILAPNCDWWEVSSRTLKDASGVELYYRFKEKYGKIIPVKMAGVNMHLVTDIDYIRIILDNSPFIFGAGILKYKMFKSFMEFNLGISEGCPWVKRRTLNINVLDTDRLHEYAPQFHNDIGQVLTAGTLPTTFQEFSLVAKKITMLVVFGTDKVVEQVFQIFNEANSMKALTEENYKIDPQILSVYTAYLRKNIAKPNPHSLMYLATQGTSDEHELIHQIPHWIFPIVGLIHTSIPRILLLLSNHPDKLQKLLAELGKLPNLNAETIYNLRYLRNCVLETLRLNNPVVTTFRKSLFDYDFPDGDSYPKGTQFVILNNPVLRDPEFFSEPNKYIPERWTAELELTYNVIMFNQGPQRCPGKELAIFILQSFLVQYLQLYGPNLNMAKIDTNNVPQMINPCTIKIGTGTGMM